MSGVGLYKAKPYEDIEQILGIGEGTSYFNSPVKSEQTRVIAMSMVK